MSTALHKIQSELLLKLLEARRPLPLTKSFADRTPLTLTMWLLMLWPALSVWLLAAMFPLQLSCLLGRNGRRVARSLLSQHEAKARVRYRDIRSVNL